MLLGLLVAPIAAAAPCGDLGALVGQARAAFDDAEVDRANALCAEANAALLCQEEPLDPTALLELYRVEALTALAQDDRKGATYATIRAVVAEPSAAPGVDLGPELFSLWVTWRARLASTMVTFRVDDGEAWVDGHRLTPDAPLKVLAGEHVVQWRAPDHTISELHDAQTDHVVHTALGEGGVEVIPPAEVERRSRKVFVWIGATAAGVGLLELGAGYLRERAFLHDPYAAEEYGHCAIGDACFTGARTKTIREDAAFVNALYLGGYGLVLGGSAAIGFGLLAPNVPSVEVGGRF